MTLPACNRIRRGLAISVTMVVLVGGTMVQMAFTGSGSEPAAIDPVVTGPSESPTCHLRSAAATAPSDSPQHEGSQEHRTSPQNPTPLL